MDSQLANAKRMNYVKQWRQNNTDKLKAYAEIRKTQTTWCDICKRHVKKANISSHNKTKKHKASSVNYDANYALWEKRILSVLRKLIDF